MKRMMKIMLLLIGVCVLLLSAPTVSAVSLSVSPNLQQVFRGSSVDLSCVDDGQTADGWTVKRTRGGLTEDCGGFGRLLGSYCVVDLSAPSETFWCEDSSGQQGDRVSLSVQSDDKDKAVILEIPALPVRTGSDVILRCRQRNGDTVAAYFFIKGRQPDEAKLGNNITNITQADEGLYWCITDQGGKSPQSSLRVRDPPKIIHPPPSHCPPPPSTSTNFAPPLTCPPSPPLPASTCPPPPSLLVPVVAGLVSGLLLVLVLGLFLFLCSKLKGGRGAELWSCGGDGCLTRSVCLCFSGLFLLTAAGVCVLLLSALTVSTAPPPCESVLRLFCHLVVFCPYCISTGLLLSICCSRKTPNKQAVSMEMSQCDGGGQGLTEDGDDVTADVTTEHAF
ncbi:uncharacterized protein LOC120715430 [Simochromis diagramma]|uniref:uncharacterized protein LOC120715430 n=1 Tax=Simochromis diagramma TaxID=43689 RepID=UPI001A7E7A92|nr:uncharacterized protein LOC120715430 [Simochromis diagramma]